MVFFASEICKDGCQIEKAGIMSILSGFMFLIACGIAYKSAPMDRSMPKSSCCCCPMPIAHFDSLHPYTAIRMKEEEGEEEEAPEEKALVAQEEAPKDDDGDQ